MKHISIVFTVILALTLSVSASAQYAKQQKTVQAQVKEMYVCPMHPEIVSEKADKCSKCGMNLVKQATEKKVDEMAKAKKSVAKESYACPMHPEVVADKAGKCSKCGMNLVKTAVGMESGKSMKPENLKLEVGKEKK